MESKKHMKKSSYAKGEPSGARGKPQHAKGDGVGAKPNREKSAKGQGAMQKGRIGKPFKRSDK